MTWPRKQLKKPLARRVRKCAHKLICRYENREVFESCKSGFLSFMDIYIVVTSAIIDVISTATINNVMSTTGVTAKEVDVVELHDCFSTNELITYEALVSHPAVS